MEERIRLVLTNWGLRTGPRGPLPCVKFHVLWGGAYFSREKISPWLSRDPYRDRDLKSQNFWRRSLLRVLWLWLPMLGSCVGKAPQELGPSCPVSWGRQGGFSPTSLWFGLQPLGPESESRPMIHTALWLRRRPRSRCDTGALPLRPRSFPLFSSLLPLPPLVGQCWRASSPGSLSP